LAAEPVADGWTRQGGSEALLDLSLTPYHGPYKSPIVVRRRRPRPGSGHAHAKRESCGVDQWRHAPGDQCTLRRCLHAKGTAATVPALPAAVVPCSRPRARRYAPGMGHPGPVSLGAERICREQLRAKRKATPRKSWPPRRRAARVAVAPMGARPTRRAARLSRLACHPHLNIKLEYKVKTVALCTLKRYLFFFSLYI
jgi:hypothetical protein